MAQAQPPRLRITEPGEAAQIIPYLVGFTPEESLVATIFQNGRVQLTARVDLADIQPTGVVEGLLDRMLDRFPNSGVFAVAYTADHQAGWNLLARCDEWLSDGCQSMLVDADHWHTPDGNTGPVDLYGTVAAQATYYGLQRLGSRADLAARFDSAPDSDQLDRQVDTAIAGLPEPGQTDKILTLTRTLIERNLPPDADADADAHRADHSPALDPREAIQLAVLVQHPAARDLALLSIDRDNATRHLQLWQAVINASPSQGADMPLYLAGMAAWVSGDGASATIAADRVREADTGQDPAHPVQFLEGLIDQVVSPSMWPPLRDTILFSTDQAVRSELDRPADAPAPHPTPAGWPPTPKASGRTPEHGTRKPPSPGITI
ncbi:MAG: DUF4192 domain-containing protein [Propionicimonas sp.]|uniref:DUF4192 domain-containing protein n=1 Tax=Propionicimonas sp. TaxID=1955623 RepID=UPI003D0F3526